MSSSYGEKSSKETLIGCVLDTPPQYSDVVTTSSLTPARRSTIWKDVWGLSLLLALIGFMGLAATSFLVYGHRSTPEYAQGIYQTKMQFRGTDGADVQQHVSSSVADSYVIHHMIKPNEQMWIVDDFTAGIQAMKIATPEESVCYATHLNRTLSPLPGAYLQSDNKQQKPDNKLSRVQTVFMASETPMTDLRHLGAHVLDLCFDVPVYWVSPVTVDRTAFTHDLTSQQQQQGGRYKRNVKKCLESCCYLVCCCNQRYLQWQSDDSFNCNHICSGCTPKSLTNIRQMC